MKIKKIQFTNFRKFENLSIDFNESNMNIIIGVNGSGKSTILDGVSYFLNHIIYSISGQRKADYSGNIKIGKSISEVEFDFELYSKGPSHLILEMPKVNSMLQILPYNLKEDFFPLIRYFKDFRNFAHSANVQSIFNDSRFNSYTTCFSNIIFYEELLNWYLEIINLENQEKINLNNTKYELPIASNVRNIFNTYLKAIDSNIDEVKITKDPYSNKRSLFIRKKDELLEFENLSSGEKNVIAVLLDLLYRASVAHPNKNDLSTTEGIVLIDEVELHLHPKLQSTFLKALQNVFPNIQFIVTTHSPNTINQFSIEDIIVLNDEGIQTKELIETYGKDVNTILEEIMGSTSRPNEIQKQFDDIRNLIEVSEDTETIHSKLTSLKNMLGGLDTELTELETLLAFKQLNETHS